MHASGLHGNPITPRFTDLIAILLSRGVAIRCSLHGLGIAPNVKESVVKGVLLSSPSPRSRMFRANESHTNITHITLVTHVSLTRAATELAHVFGKRDGNDL
jgi:hypothetical protein